MKSDKELADEVDAGRRLMRNGYELKTCPSCEGTGLLHVREWKSREPLEARTCQRCDGRGEYWMPPVTQTK